ncbi:MAG: LOG family protein, partial [Campylobacteraceae bacterium]|nr:LOG family protein [Campylobacteraceae bacterium]
DLIVILPGQIGTLEEMFAAWVEAIKTDNKPLIVLGEKMIRLVEFLHEFEYIKEHQFAYIQKVRNIEDLRF